MKATYEYDQDPRYGWVNINMEEKTTGTIVVQDSDGVCHGFTFAEGSMTPTCICSAWYEHECSCSGVDWG